MGDVAGTLVAGLIGGGAVGALLLLALRTWGVQYFAARELVLDKNGDLRLVTKSELNGMAQRIEERFGGVKDRLDYKAKKIERNVGLFVSLEDRVGDLESKTALIEERQTQQWARISDQMASTARTIENVGKKMEEVSGMQQRLAVELERRHKTRKEEGGG